MSDDLISLQQAAALIGKNLRTVQRLIKSGKISRHLRDGKSFVSHEELEKKFAFITTSAAESRHVQTETSAVGQTTTTQDFQQKWIEEVEKHAETREELGIWKGRAEAYQAFAGRLLGNGNAKNINEEINLKKDESTKESRPDIIPSSNLSPLYYVAFAILFAILILLFVLIRVYTG